jgi:hypothetical protein
MRSGSDGAGGLLDLVECQHYMEGEREAVINALGSVLSIDH